MSRINDFTVCATIILSQAYFAKFTPVFATSSSCFACATLYAEVKRKKKVDVLLVLLCRDPSNLCKIHNKNCVTKTWCWINGRVTRSLSRPLVQRYLTAELCSLSSLFVSLERAFSGSIEILLYYTQYAFNWNFSKPRNGKGKKKEA